jgi:hypothetical protein
LVGLVLQFGDLHVDLEELHCEVLERRVQALKEGRER